LWRLRTFNYLSRECKKPRSNTNFSSKNDSIIKKECNRGSTSYSTITCNYCKKPGNIVKDCRKLKYNNEQKAKSVEGSLTTAAIKTIGDIKNRSIIMLKYGAGKDVISLNSNQINQQNKICW